MHAPNIPRKSDRAAAYAARSGARAVQEGGDSPYGSRDDGKANDEGAEDYTVGRNDYGRRSYDGPRPPEGHGLHRYYFWLMALDSDLRLDAGLSLRDLLGRVESNVLGMSRLVGGYER